MAIHSSILAWRILGTGEPDGLPCMGLHRVGHDWSDLAAAAEVTHMISNKISLARIHHMGLPYDRGLWSQILHLHRRRRKEDIVED